MFKKVYLDPENKTFSEVMSNNKSYEVPPFQRDYTWEDEQLDELWQDIQHMKEHNTQHFMGYLVLQSTDNKFFQVIDGQQRITTITLLIVAMLARFQELIAQGIEANDNEKRREETHKRYLGVFNVVTLRTSLKLSLNRNNKAHFKEISNQPYGVSSQRGITATNRKLNKAFEFFDSRVSKYSGTELAELIEILGDGLLFTTITVSDDLDAYLVFETLNARGVHLSAPDLLKNYLLSTLQPGENSTVIEDFGDTWNETIDQLGETNFTAFLRSYEGMFSKLRQKKELYRYLKTQRIKLPEQVFPYIDDLKKKASVYAALQNPDDAYWKEYEKSNYLAFVDNLSVLKLFSIKTPLSLLMAAYDKYSVNDFTKLVKWLVVVSVRYNVICGKSTNEQERAYNRISMSIMSKDPLSLTELKDRLKSDVYPDDDEFVSAFSIKTMSKKRSPKKIIYLLRAIAEHIDGGKRPAENLTLEHVLPYSPTDQWQEYFGRETYNEAIDRLANFALLSASKNRDIDRAGFEDKKVVLKNSGIQLNKQIAEYDRWDIDAVNARQNWLAKQAKTVWRIN